MIRFRNREFFPQENESVLDCLIRQGENPPHSCRSGLCQSCLMRATHGKPSPSSQKGLKPGLVEQNYFLPCSCVADNDMEIELVDASQFQFQTPVIDKTPLSDNILRLRLRKPENYVYRAGQFLSLFKDQQTCRTYSLASSPERDDFLELHIRIYPDGQLSQWINQTVQTNTVVSVGQAIGSCIYSDVMTEHPLALIGTGTGLAPLYGILRSAFTAGHKAPVKLYHGVQKIDDLYLHSALNALATSHENFEYIPCVSGDIDAGTGIFAGRASDIALKQIKDFSDYYVFICGNPEMVNATKRSVFLAGASMKHIASDTFLPAS